MMGDASPSLNWRSLSFRFRECRLLAGVDCASRRSGRPDGGFMINSEELETAVRLRLNLVVPILPDNAYGMIRCNRHGGESSGHKVRSF
jgi:hypothetical protein